jgi:amino acid permease
MRQINISNNWTIGIFIYYSTLFLTSLILLICYFSKSELNDKDVYFYSSLSGLLGSTIFYTRKLYKDCFTENKISQEKDNLKRIATTVYFITRPFFAAAFSIMIIIGLKSGFIIISTSKNEINMDNFIFVSVFLSFIGGFRVGKVINKFENIEIIK